MFVKDYRLKLMLTKLYKAKVHTFDLTNLEKSFGNSAKRVKCVLYSMCTDCEKHILLKNSKFRFVSGNENRKTSLFLMYSDELADSI